ncbi:CIA30 family protein [Litoribaculum gwangyangense]|uniref:CIA30 family protein n=1 Tax=Litoribaculum gwangyangense TaxID=1130722 RepID=A0ABP9CRE7_9FLAO
MKFNIIFFILINLQAAMTIFNFNSESNLTNWRIVHDVVMGGKSDGNFSLNKVGHGLFKGKVSLENNGGFSMVQYSFDTKNVSDYSKVVLKLKGDGKTYQFRIKSNNNDYYSYVSSFETTGDWEVIEIPFKEFYAAFRGRKLNQENYPGKQMEMVAFLIGNKIAESFELELESIVLK